MWPAWRENGLLRYSSPTRLPNLPSQCGPIQVRRSDGACYWRPGHWLLHLLNGLGLLMIVDKAISLPEALPLLDKQGAAVIV